MSQWSNNKYAYMSKFSIEDVFNIVEMKHKSAGIVFKPLSKAYASFPYGVTIIAITNQELEVMLQNILNKRYTRGLIYAKGYDNNPDNKNEIAIIFHTNDIEEIEYV